MALVGNAAETTAASASAGACEPVRPGNYGESEDPVVVAFVLNDGNSKHVEGRVEAGTIVAETPQWSCDRHISVAVLVSLNKQQFSSKPEATQYWRHFTYFFRPRIAAIARSRAHLWERTAKHARDGSRLPPEFESARGASKHAKAF